MDEVKMACEILRPVSIVAVIISTIVSIFIAVIMKQHEKRHVDEGNEVHGFIKRKNREDDERDKKIDNLETSLYKTFADVRVAQEKHTAHKELCEERHKGMMK